MDKQGEAISGGYWDVSPVITFLFNAFLNFQFFIMNMYYFYNTRKQGY